MALVKDVEAERGHNDFVLDTMVYLLCEGLEYKVTEEEQMLSSLVSLYADLDSSVQTYYRFNEQELPQALKQLGVGQATTYLLAKLNGLGNG